MARLKLNDANYYSRQANMDYMSASQFKAFRRCEAAALAELQGEWNNETTTAMLVGSYVDAYFSGELSAFEQAHPEMFKKDGSLKAEFTQALRMAQRLERDELSRMLLAGDHQKIKTGKIAGVWFKGKYDSLLSSRKVARAVKRFPELQKAVPFGGPMIIDLKTCRDFQPVWDEDVHEKVSFMQYWRYDIQGAIYQALDKRMAPFGIVAVTKEPEPDIGAFLIPDSDLQFALAEVESLAPRYDQIKNGKVKPVGCGKCAYCKRLKSLTELADWNSINGGDNDE